MTKAEMNRRLDQLGRLARGPAWRRLLHAPGRYLSGQFFQKVVYPRRKRGRPASARTFWGRKMRIVLPAAMDIFLLGGKTHDSEQRLTRFLLHRLQPGDRVADIGAHYGFFTLLAARLTGPSGRVEAFEPAAGAFNLLRHNTEALPQVDAHHLAISDQAGEISFYEFPTLYSEYNTLEPEQFEGEPWYERHPPVLCRISTMSLDDFCRQHDFQPTLIKIDVEGAEDKVIAGMQEMLATGRPIVVMEYLAEERLNVAHRQAARSLRERGYRPHRITPSGDLEPLESIEASLKARGLDSDNIVFLG